MGYYAHHAIVVTGGKEEIEQAHDLAVLICELGGPTVTPPLSARANGFASFAILPDGSKEGWECSARGDECRQRFITGLRESGIRVDFVEVRFGGDNPGATSVVQYGGE